jgi:hypothetical protein
MMSGREPFPADLLTYECHLLDPRHGLGRPPQG